MAKKKWISGAVAEGKGKLHEHLHVPQGEKIPEEKMEEAMHSKNSTIRKEANLAKTLKKFHPAAKKKTGTQALYGTRE